MTKRDPGNRPYALDAGEGWIYRFGIDMAVKASEIQPGSGAAFLEYTTKQGEEPGNHTHETENEMFYVLEGAVSFQCGGETFDLKKGGFIFLPCGIEHGYKIKSKKPARLIVVTSPVRDRRRRGWKGFVADMESGQGELIGSPGHRP